MKRATATLVSPATTTAAMPATPSTATEATTAHPSATATARGVTSAWNRAPCPALGYSGEAGRIAWRRRQLCDGRELQQQEQDQSDGAEGADAAVAHDHQPLRGIVAAERVQAVGEPIQMESTGHQLPRGHGQQRGEQHREGPRDETVDEDEDAADQESDRREPGHGPTGRRANGGAPATDRNDGQVAGGLQGALHGDSRTFGLTTAVTRRTLGGITASHGRSFARDSCEVMKNISYLTARIRA